MTHFDFKDTGSRPPVSTNKGNNMMRLNCSQCKKALAEPKIIKVVSDTDVHSFCSIECKDEWLRSNAEDYESFKVTNGVFILSPLSAA